MSENKFKITWLHAGDIKGENYGNFLQRVSKPCSLWQDDPLISVTELPVQAPEAFDFSLNCDLLVIIQCNIHWLWFAVQHRKNAGLATLYEINDDIASLGNWLPHHHTLKSPLTRQPVLNIAACCDAVLFSSSELANYYQVLHPKRLVVDPWVTPLHVTSKSEEEFVIGWGGSATHLDDLLWVAPALSRFLTTHPDARFFIMGSSSNLSEFLNALPSAQVTCFPFGDEVDYFSFLQSLHVGIAPLKDTRFNRCRSDGKFVQYAINGCASLLSDLPPFSDHRERAILFDSPEAMYNGLEQFYRDRATLSQFRDIAYHWAQKYRSPEAVKHHLQSIFSIFLPEKPRAGYGELEFWSEEKRSTWWEIIANINKKQFDKSVELCYSLLNESVDLPQVRWLLVQSLFASGRREQAFCATQHPTQNTIWADEFLALAYSITPNSDGNRKADLRGKLQHPLKKLHLKKLPASDLEGYFRSILDWLPYDYFSLFGLIQILQKKNPADEELDTLMPRARLMLPEG